MRDVTGSVHQRRLHAIKPTTAGTGVSTESGGTGADQGLYLIMCGTAPGSPDADALSLLASWNATGNAETALKQT